MTSTHHDKATTGPHSRASTEMDRYGITCVPVDYFHLGQYGYTNLEDAIAEAKRQLANGRSHLHRPESKVRADRQVQPLESALAQCRYAAQSHMPPR